MSNLALNPQNRLAQAIGVAGVLAAGLLLAPHSLRAQTLTTLYSFCQAGLPCPDGSSPNPLIQGSDGNFYGTTYYGGITAEGAAAYDSGTVFKLTPSGSLTTLYIFCLGGTPCSDGAQPLAALVQGGDGNFYGTTYSGGSSSFGGGTIFDITTGGTLGTIYTFCQDVIPPGVCADGESPRGSLIQVADGTFYGTTWSGGLYSGGAVFTFTLSGGYGGVLYNFCVFNTGCLDGDYPIAGLVQAPNGNFYGTTSSWGPNNQEDGGTVFELTPGGTLTTLYPFCSTSAPYDACTDGAFPEGVILGSDGNLYGTTYYGGAYSSGAIFSLTPGGMYTNLYSFHGTTGASPATPLIQASDGNFYGTVSSGGAYYYGGIFSITSGGIYTLIYSFCSQGTYLCPDGYNPSGLVQGTDGNLYGTTQTGGVYGYGTVFKLTLPGPAVTFSSPSLNFGSVPMGTQSAAMSVAVTNSGNANLTLGTVTVSGANYSDFNITSDTCSGQTITPNNTCTVSVAFTPSLPLGESAVLKFPDNGPGSLQTLGLSGTGAAPVASLSPTYLTFSPQPVGTTGGQQPIILNNTGTLPLAIASIVTQGNFGQINSCGSSLAAGSSCPINVTFTPATTGTVSGSLVVTDNSGGYSGTQQTAMLIGTGEPVVPNVVGDTEGAATSAITGAGLTLGTVTIESSATVQAGEVISESPGAGTVVSLGSAVNLTVSSGPPDQENITVTDTDWVTPLSSVSAPVVYFSAGPTIGFSGASGSQTLTVSDIGLNPLALSSFIVSGQGAAQFSVTLENCSNSATSLATTLPSGGACAFNIAYTPSATPTNDNATLTFTDSAGFSNLTTTGTSPSYMQSISLSGSGMNSPVPPSTVTVPNVVDDAESAAESAITAANLTVGTVTIESSSTVPAGDVISESPAAGMVVSLGSAVNLTVSSGLPDQENITVSDQSLILVPNSINFGEVPISSTSSAQSMTLANAGSAALAISEISAVGNFSVQTSGTTCGTTGLGANTNCTVSLTFTPKGSGTITGTLTISIPGNPQTVTLSGTGVIMTSGLPPTPLQPPPPGTVSPGEPVNAPPVSGGGVSAPKGAPGRQILPSHSSLIPLPPATTITVAPAVVSSAPAARFSASTLTFSAQAVGTASLARTITLTNSSPSPLAIASITAGGDFTQTNNCGESVAAGDSCTIKVIFKPAATGTRTGALTINADALGSTHMISLSGTGKRAEP